MPPPIQVFLTTIASQPALRQRQEYILRVLQVKKIPFESYDLASDEAAKRLWKRKAPLDKQQLPGILVGNRFPGTFADFEDAVECETLAQFLRLNEDYEDDGDETLLKPSQPVGVPGVALPQQVTNQKPSFASVPSPHKNTIKDIKSGKAHDAGEELGDARLQGVKVTDSELTELLKDLGLSGNDADELANSLGANQKDAEKVSGKEKEGKKTKPEEGDNGTGSVVEGDKETDGKHESKTKTPELTDKNSVTDETTKLKE